jgi:hypothetical protein
MATQVSLNSGAVASAGALALQTNGTTEAVSISTGQVATLAQNPVLTSGTANGVLYLNGSKVATSGSALTFDGTNLGIGTSSGRGGLNIATPNGIALGDSSAPTDVNGRLYITYSQSGNSGAINAYKNGTYGQFTLDGNPSIFNVTGSEQMRLTSTGLGIGTSSPASKLHVNGAMRSGLASTTTGELALFSNANDTQMGIINTGTEFKNYATYASTGGYKPITWYTSDTKQMTLDSSGNLGLGVTPSGWSANYKPMQLGQYASVAAEIGSVGQALFANNVYATGTGSSPTYNRVAGSSASMYLLDANVHKWFTAGTGAAGSAITFTQAMTLDASGSLGIGVTSVPEALTVKPNGTGANLGLNLVNNASNLSGVLFSTNAAPATSYTYIKGDGRSSGFITLSTNDTERMRIDSSGNVLVGTTSVNFTGSGLTLSSNAGTTKWLVGPYSGASGQFYVCSSSSTGVYLSSTSATSWSSNSDFNLKTDLVAIENAAEKVASLRAVTGRYKTDPEGTSRAFLIAQDVQAVLPEAVAPTTMYDGTEVLGLAYTEVIPLLVAAIKEQQAIIEQLTSRIAALETKGA